MSALDGTPDPGYDSRMLHLITGDEYTPHEDLVRYGKTLETSATPFHGLPDPGHPAGWMIPREGVVCSFDPMVANLIRLEVAAGRLDPKKFLAHMLQSGKRFGKRAGITTHKLDSEGWWEDALPPGMFDFGAVITAQILRANAQGALKGQR